MLGAGEKSFSSGGDLKAHLDNYKQWQNNQSQQEVVQNVINHLKTVFTCSYKLATLKDTLFVSFLNGYVMGQGAGYGMNSHIKIATEKTVFAMPEVQIGFFADASGSYFLNQIPDNLGIYLAMTGKKINGMEMKQMQLCDFYIDTNMQQELIKSLAYISNFNEGSNKFQLQQLYHEYLDYLQRQNYNEDHIIYQKYKNYEYIREIFEVDSFNEILVNLDKYQHKDFVKEIKYSFEKAAPWSLLTNFELYYKSKKEKLSLKECVLLDYRLGYKLVQNADFFEGIRCTLIDRGDTPKWKHKSIYEIDPQEIKAQLYEELPYNLEKELIQNLEKEEF
ncbi:hypothetical protein PPERSA_09869 [Pseudocohnilembus persalinus]|uniref:3-hydroxyisobutyryl-CoA hydrolase n=1 Tax=Pseudocohnilembus persalinus TaxID=266149 RepID=A0A0V0QU42_PSEPJ|nr:hypothetical protein PPERSA_09869 [Pseudocohnilembus persalinus]|eukprot:KRX05729.1 hypothetical protein PPERSA_09869 [Pseudocohnilembus persalinus]